MTKKAVPLVESISDQYIKEHGISKYEQVPFSIMDAMRSADTYETLEHQPENPLVKASYALFISHLIKQFTLLIDMGFDIVDGQGIHNYDSSDNLREDISNGKIVYLPTYANDGSYSEIVEGHPLAGYHNIYNVQYCLNDIFRIVHDFYGHGMGYSFGPEGEHYAWEAHRRMLPREAHLALWCETRAQNSWVNFGKHIRDAEDFIPLTKRPFAQQKCVIPPMELV